MLGAEVTLLRIISIASANGFWVTLPQEDKSRPNEFLPVGFWLAGEFRWNSGKTEERVIPIWSSDFYNVTNQIKPSQELTEAFGAQVYHASDFDVIGKTLRRDDD
jgi:hypothetical protein